MAQYRFGSVSVTNGSAVVAGLNTFWLANASVGNLFSIAGQGVWYSIHSVDSDSQITLTTPFAGTTAAGASYGIQRDFTPNQNYPTPSYGDQDTASLIAQTLLQLDAQMSALSPVAQVLNGSITIAGGLSLTLTGGQTSISGLTTLDASSVYLNSSGVTKLTVSSTGVAITNLTVSGTIVGNAATASKLVAPSTLSFSGDATGSMSFDGSANVSAALTLAATGITAGSYSNLTVDAKGRVTGIRAISLTTDLGAGSANGLATLDSGGHIPLTQLPAVIQGAMSYQGTWNASTNTPTLTSSVGTKGYLYKVTVAGSTTLNGVSQWNVGDNAVFNGSTWDKWDGVSSEVLSVAGMTGAVTLTSSNLTDSTAVGRTLLTAATTAAQKTALSITSADVSGLVASATTDTTNAANITSGTLSSARLPAATGAVLGGVIVGSNLTISAGTISLSSANVTGALSFTPANKAGDTFSGVTTFQSDVKITGTGELWLPVGTTAQRTGSPSTGMVRFNSDSGFFEGYAAGVWANFSTSGMTNAQITTALGYTPANKAGDTFTGPIFVNGGALGSAAASSVIGFAINDTDTNGDALQSVLYRGSTGSDWSTAYWRLQRKVDSTLMGYIEFNNNSTKPIALGTGATEFANFNGAGLLTVPGGIAGSSLQAPNSTTLGGVKPGTTANIASDGTIFDAVGFRNRVINGDMRIDQRNTGAAQTITAGAALSYTVDRWYAYCTGANVAGQRVAGGSGPYANLYQFTGAASVTGIGFGQRIEATNSQDLAGSTATLSCVMANSLLTTVTWTAYYATTTDAFGTLASPTKTQFATGTFTIGSTLAVYSAAISIPSAATTGIEIVFSVGAQTSGTWKIGTVQLETGSYATPFERLPWTTQQLLCYRYYWGLTICNIGLTSTNLNWTSQPSIVFPTIMRAVPSISGSFSVSAGNVGTLAAYLFQQSATIYNGSGNWNQGSFSASVNFAGSFSAEL